MDAITPLPPTQYFQLLEILHDNGPLTVTQLKGRGIDSKNFTRLLSTLWDRGDVQTDDFKTFTITDAGGAKVTADERISAMTWEAHQQALQRWKTAKAAASVAASAGQ